jgi:formylglycine-generating enzyme required for sulfatase activity
MADIFISYAREDWEMAKTLAQALAGQGWSVWWDRSIPPGKRWADVIGKQLITARCVLALWSKTSVIKRWVLKEASSASQQGILIPVLIGDVEPPLFEFGDIQAADLTDWRGDGCHPSYKLLLRSVLEVLSASLPATADEQGAMQQVARRETETPPREVPLVRIFLSSPGDVTDERTLARQVDAELPKHPSLRGRLALELIAWDDPAARIPMLATETPQDSVNAARPRPANCDIVIVILWSRMGTPLPDSVRKPNGEPYFSGTEWEYEDAVRSPRQPGPEVFVYRRTETPKVALDDPKLADKLAQFQRVETFFAQFRNADGSLKGGINEYATPSEFKTLLSQHLQEVVWRRLVPSRDDGEAQPVVATIPSEYLAWLQRACSDISLLGQDNHMGQAFTLNHVYVPALTRSVATPKARPRSRRERRELPEEQKPITLLQRLDQESLYVPAPAGTGKSTFCRWAALQSITSADIAHSVPAPGEFMEPVPAALRGRLPLLVPLREFWTRMDGGRGRQTWYRTDLERALAAWVDAWPPERGLTGNLLRAHLKAGTSFLLLDGLDEVPASETWDSTTVYPRQLLLSGLIDAWPDWQEKGNRLLLTSRPYGLDEAGLHRLGLPSASLEPLPEFLQDLFITRWFHTLNKAEQTPGLIETIRGRDDLAALIENPMLLTALCILYESGGRLPEDRYELYKRIVNTVLFHRFPGDAREREPVKARLEAIALGMHTGESSVAPRQTPVAEIGWGEMERLLAHFAELNPAYESGRVQPAVQREDLLTRSGLLLPRTGDRAAFYHLSFQEFLASERIARTTYDPQALEQVFGKRRAVPEWRPTLLFLFAAQIFNYRDAQWGLDLLARLIKDQDRAAVKANPAPAVFIAEALDLCLAKKYSVSETLRDDFRQLALNAIDDAVELPARLALGRCMGGLGDPRIRGLRDPSAYVEVPTGTYPCGDDGKTVEIAAPFRIGRYPATNGQYQAFIDGGGYHERRWWSEGGWAWRQRTEVTEPVYWRERRWNGQNQPVVGVSLWEAEACSTWAGGRLPREEEWEATARGREGSVYPWGNDWQDGICNTAETGLAGPSPVGLFPYARQARLGIEDLAGNVWEWCGSLYDPSDTKDQDAPRVLRGGSWFDLQDIARSALRYRGIPYDRDINVGFRVVCSFLSSGTDH